MNREVAHMDKGELIHAVAEKANQTRKDAEAAIGTVFEERREGT